MARSLLTTEGSNFSILNTDGRIVVRTSATTLYEFLRQPSPLPTVGTLCYRKSTDNGVTWSTGVSTTTAVPTTFCVWYDQWTPGDSGTKIHIWSIEDTTDDVEYRNLDTASDTLSSLVDVFAGATAVANSMVISGCKARGGNLYVAFDMDGGAETGFYRSTDGGATWAARTDMNEGAADLYILCPGNYADNQDIDTYFWDASASEISRKFYDDSANTHTETSIATGMTLVAKTTAGPQFSVTLRHSDGLHFIAAWNSRDVATADLQAWSDDGTTITALTNIVTNSDDCHCVHLHHERDTNTLYAFYLGKSDGSQTIGTSLGVYYKTSTDGGSTWSAEQTLVSELDAYLYIGGPPTSAASPKDVTFYHPRELWFHCTLPSVGFFTRPSALLRR